ncbi:MAG: hypothetical protein NTW64_05580 [Candidatus Omnitrophica bacterium]|nr:hypothetical protein [Candidatus Omnitrophota bacterium]
MVENHFLEKQEENISIHIFSVSAAMVGVCITVFGIFTISQTLKKISGLGDELMALDSVLFLVSCLLSYMAIRNKMRRNRYRLERLADIFFLVGLCIMGLTSVLLVLEFL